MASSSADTTSPETSKTPAQLMQEKHEAAEHRVTVEDVVDQDDIEHPPPTSQLPHEEEKDTATNGVSNGPMSAKAAGKQKARDTTTAIDTQSEEAFPVLGSGPKPRAAAAPVSWGKKAFSSVAPNGTTPNTSRGPSSGASTPTSGRGISTPSTVSNPPIRPQQYGQAPERTMLPGRYRDTLEVGNNEIDRTKSMQNLLQDILRKSNVKVNPESSKNANAIRFVAEGRKEAVIAALLRISEELTLRQKREIEIPAALKSHIIGRAGSNVAALEKKHRVKIQVQDKKAATPSVDGLETSTVEIEGHAAGVRLASVAILELVKERQPRVDLPLRDVPPQFFPFITRQHAERLQQMEQEHDLKIRIPHFDSWQSNLPARSKTQDGPTFTPHPEFSIVVSGDHARAIQARSEIEQLAKQLEQSLQMQEHPFERSLHPFIVGERGLSQEEFLNQTGCIVLLPSSHDDSEDITIVGPSHKLQSGYDMAVQRAARISRQPVDLHRSFMDAPKGADYHSRALARYLQKKKLEEEFRKVHNADIVFPTAADPATTWNVFSQESTKALQARSDLMKIVQAFPPQRLNMVEMDPFFYPHLHQLCANDLQNDLGVHMIIPRDGENHVVLVYEGAITPDTPFDIPRQKPSSHDLAIFQTFLQQAENRILSKTGEQVVSTSSLDAPRQYHDKVRKYVRGLRQPEPPEGFPVQIDYGKQLHPGGATTNGTTSPEHKIYLRGQGADNVEDLRKKIVEFLLQAEEDEKQRSYTTTLAFPKQYLPYLIGKQGANINALREKHDVEIDAKDPEKVRIKGPQKYAEACKEEINRLAKQLADEVTFRIKIEPRFFGALIGKDGENMNKLRDKVNREVIIQLPPRARYDDGQSVADTASETGSHRNSRMNQAPDEIIIRGPRLKAEKVKAELEEFYNHIKETSHEATVSVAKGQVPQLMGRGGQEIDKLRLDTGATILVPKDDSAGPEERVSIKIKGSKQAVEKAKSELQKRSQAYDDVTKKTINVDRKYHHALIGVSGSNIRRIVIEAGGAENNTEAVQFPKKGSSSDEVTITGTKAVVDKIVAALQAAVTEKENETTEHIDVPEDRHHVIIGRGGESRRALEQEFNVKLDVPRPKSGTTVKITGNSADVEKAKAEVIRRTHKPAGITILVPKSLHHIVGKNGQIFPDYRKKGVTIDHGGQKPPPKPSRATPGRTGNGPLPLITDDTDSTPFSWEIVETNPASNGDSATIPWILTGKPEQVEAAKAEIEESIASASEAKTTGYLILSDPSLHRHIIGRSGSKINEIRKETNCDIQVPKRASGSGEEGEAITVVGSKEGCEQAKVMILEAVKRGQNGDGSRPTSSRA